MFLKMRIWEDAKGPKIDLFFQEKKSDEGLLRLTAATRYFYRTEKLPKFWYSLPTLTPQKLRYGEGYYSMMMTHNNHMVKIS